jgi:hypothetical protein
MDRIPETDRWPTIFLAGILGGLVVAAAAWSWQVVAKPTALWSNEKAAELQQATTAVHEARRTHGRSANAAEGSSTDSLDAGTAALAAAEERFNELNDELERARSARESWGKWGAIAGLALTILCGLGYLATRGQ